MVRSPAAGCHLQQRVNSLRVCHSEMQRVPSHPLLQSTLDLNRAVPRDPSTRSAKRMYGAGTQILNNKL